MYPKHGVIELKSHRKAAVALCAIAVLVVASQASLWGREERVETRLSSLEVPRLPDEARSLAAPIEQAPATAFK
jgi:hypothetical protein